jgi:hypothetical protein
MKVVHTNQWPIPYYQRVHSIPRTLYPENDYNVTMTGHHAKKTDEVNVNETQMELKKTMEGREVLETMHSMGLKGTMCTSILSPRETAEVYIDDML